MCDNPYDRTFYAGIDEESLASAEVVVPIVQELLPINSVVDIGCGHGVWLSVFREHGVSRVVGVDGPWVSMDELAIPNECFVSHNLTEEWPALDKFDLALSLEVAEHLPKAYAQGFVRELSTLAPSVLFSAAVPGQQGRGHLNEQWPQFWESLFASRGFLRLDPIRRHIWMNPRVAWYYQQNLYLYVHGDVVARSEKLGNERSLAKGCDLTLVHPKILRHARSFKGALRMLRHHAIAALKRRWHLPFNSSRGPA